jgi:hypothetical protein
MNSLEYLQSVYSDPLQETHVRMRAAALAIPFEFPKLAVTAVMDERGFAQRLDEAIARSTAAKVIEAAPPRQVSGPTGPEPTKMGAPFTRPRI